MSIKHRTETPNIPYGPATGVPTPEPHNEALSTGPDHEYRKDSTPGTADHAEPRHVQGGPGHKKALLKKRCFFCFCNFTICSVIQGIQPISRFS